MTAATTADELLAELEKELALLADTEAAQLDTTLLIHPQDDRFPRLSLLPGRGRGAAASNNAYDGVFQIASHPQYNSPAAIRTTLPTSPIAPYLRCSTCSVKAASTAPYGFPDAADIFERNIETMESSATRAGAALAGKSPWLEAAAARLW